MPLQEEDLLKAVQHFAEKKAFLFDMDGLIFDTERLFMEQLAVVMKDYGYELSREIYQETLGMRSNPLAELMCSHYGKDYPFYDISQETNRRVQIVAETVGLSIKPQIQEVLKYLNKSAIPCAVVSSTESDKVAFYLQKAGLDSFFQKIIGGEMTEKSKPEPDIFLHACQSLELLPQECAVLEDSENGVRAAYAAGCDIICVPDLKMPSKEVQQMVQILVLRK